MIFYDFEVFAYDWLVVLIDLNAKQETVIINDPDKLKGFYESHKETIWAGYNSRHYDQFILKGILCLSLIHISEPTRRTPISYAVFCLKKKKKIKK